MISQQAMNLMRDCIPLFAVLSDENRHKILRLLENGQMNVSDITERLPLSRPAIVSSENHVGAPAA